VAGYKPKGALVNVTKHLYETVFVLNPELTEEDVEANIQSIVQPWKAKALRLSASIGWQTASGACHAKQRYGYYTLIHFR
jgi:hypothetical protein